MLYLPMSLAAPSPAEAGSCALGVPGPPLSSAPSHQHQDPPQILTFQLHPGVPCPQGCAPPGAQGQLCPRNPPPLHLAGSWLGTPTSWGHPCGRGSPHPGVTGLRVWFGGPQLCWWLRSFSPPSCPRGGLPAPVWAALGTQRALPSGLSCVPRSLQALPAPPGSPSSQGQGPAPASSAPVFPVHPQSPPAEQQERSQP